MQVYGTKTSRDVALLSHSGDDLEVVALDGRGLTPRLLAYRIGRTGIAEVIAQVERRLAKVGLMEAWGKLVHADVVDKIVAEFI